MSNLPSFSKVSVTAVIPTLLRSSVLRSIESARAQANERIDMDIVVVCDLPKNASVPAGVLEKADKVLFTGGGRRGSAARNMGVQASESEYVAFLDDDDVWHPEKTLRQIEALEGLGDTYGHVASCRVTQPWTTNGASLIPKNLIAVDDVVEDYLFRRRGPNIQRASLFTSSLLCRTEVARECLWDESLPRHQDWDWLIRLQKEWQVGVLQLSDPLLTIFPDSPGSISAKSDWESSLRWANGQRGRWSTETYADFLAAQTLRYALQARSWRGVREVLIALLSAGSTPSFPTVATAAAGVLPKARAMRLLSVLGRGPRMQRAE